MAVDPITLGIIGSGLLSGFFGGDGGSSEAVASQAALNKELLGIFRQQQGVEQPFRKELLQALLQRSQQQFPQMQLPAQPPVFNPFSAANTAPPAATALPQAITEAPIGNASGPIGSFLRQRAVRPTRNFQ